MDQIASLRAGGIGLNLTWANRVIITDLWWNVSLEHQAFGRVYRMGQQKETCFCRVMVKESVDQRIVEIQNEKIREIEQTNQEFNTKTQLLETHELIDMLRDFSKDSSRVQEKEKDEWWTRNDYYDDDDDDSDSEYMD